VCVLELLAWGCLQPYFYRLYPDYGLGAVPVFNLALYFTTRAVRLVARSLRTRKPITPGPKTRQNFPLILVILARNTGLP
jgi:hypothetical protein